MEQDLKLKGLSPAAIRNYLLYCRKFAAFYMRSSEELGASAIRAFLLHEVEQLLPKVVVSESRRAYPAYNDGVASVA
jgi:hypothetical protein